MVANNKYGDEKAARALLQDILSRPAPKPTPYDGAVREATESIDKYIVAHFEDLAKQTDLAWDKANSEVSRPLVDKYPGLRREITNYVSGRLENLRVLVVWIQRAPYLKDKMHLTGRLPYEDTGFLR